MTTLLLVRHAATDTPPNRLAGRAPGLHLNETGMRQADALARRLKHLDIAAVWSSPLDRAIETAQPIALALAVPLHTSSDLLEVDYGDWTGRQFEELASDPQWLRFNTDRKTAIIPAGESIEEVRHRVIRQLSALSDAYKNGLVVVITHAEVIRVALVHYLGISYEPVDRFQISNASVTIIRSRAAQPEILAINCVEDLSDVTL
jgi:broad specificity phosphatase PhoE